MSATMSGTPRSPLIRLHPADDVVIARAQLMSGSTVDGVAVRGLIPPGHKVATRAIAVGEPVRRYNQIIGFASKNIEPGEHVHVHNVAADAFERDYAFCRDCPPRPTQPQLHRHRFGCRGAHGFDGGRAGADALGLAGQPAKFHMVHRRGMHRRRRADNLAQRP